MNAFFQEIFNRLSQVFSPDVIGEKVAVIFLNLIVGTLTFITFYVVWFILNRIFRVLVNKTKMDQTTASFLEKTLKYFFITIGAIEALSSAGIDTGALLASLGIAGLTIGFAARDALSNLISGLLIFWDRPFVIGDLIQVEDYYGRVADITLRSTRVVTVDGKMLAIPNSDIINSTVASYTNFPHLRLDINVTIATTEDIDQARIVLLDIVNRDPDILEQPESKVMMTAINDYNVELQLQTWLRDEENHIPKRFELREKIFKALTTAGIEMPFETIRLTPLEIHQTNGK